jgi:hypothetical protein
MSTFSLSFLLFSYFLYLSDNGVDASTTFYVCYIGDVSKFYWFKK